MRWIRIVAVGLAAALAAIALSVGLVTADDCNRPAPDDFRSDVAWDGQGLHHQSQDVQDLFSGVWGTDDDLHVRTWAWQHNCRTQPPDEAADTAGGPVNPTDGPVNPPASSATGDQDSSGASSSRSGGGQPSLAGSGNNNASAGNPDRCGGKPRPQLTSLEIADGYRYYCDETTGEWVRTPRAIPTIDYAADDQLVAPSVGNCTPGFTHYDPIREVCLLFPDGPEV